MVDQHLVTWTPRWRVIPSIFSGSFSELLRPRSLSATASLVRCCVRWKVLMTPCYTRCDDRCPQRRIWFKSLIQRAHFDPSRFFVLYTFSKFDDQKNQTVGGSSGPQKDRTLYRQSSWDEFSRGFSHDSWQLGLKMGDVPPESWWFWLFNLILAFQIATTWGISSCFGSTGSLHLCSARWHRRCEGRNTQQDLRRSLSDHRLTKWCNWWWVVHCKQFIEGGVLKVVDWSGSSCFSMIRMIKFWTRKWATRNWQRGLRSCLKDQNIYTRVPAVNVDI